MQNAEHSRGGSRTPGARVKEFFAKLKGLWAPKYIPQRIRYGDRDRKESVQNSNLRVQSHNEKNK